MNFDYDVIIIGAGPGGYVTAIRGAQLGLNVLLVESDKLGGVCLNIGCIPSKSLIHQAQSLEAVEYLESIGVKVDKGKLTYKKVYKKSRDAADSLTSGVAYLIKKNKIALMRGVAKIANAHEIILKGENNELQTIKAKYIIIATGSSPKKIAQLDFDNTIMSSNEILHLEEVPKSLTIVGSGAIGIEFAYIMHNFGSKVSIVETQEQILPNEDREIANFLEKEFTEKGIKIYKNTFLDKINKTQNGVELLLKEKNDSNKEKNLKLESEKVLISIGRKPNTENIGLENVNIAVDEQGFVKFSNFYQTSVPNIYAIGDIIRTPMLAHVASKEGEIAIEHIAYLEGKTKENPEKVINNSIIPSAVYCEPQIASFGLTEKKAIDEGVKYKKFVFPFTGTGKAVAIQKTNGFVKIIMREENHEILGVHIVGENATEMIHEILVAKVGEMTTQELANIIHAHPTLSESIMESARGLEGWAIHI